MESICFNFCCPKGFTCFDYWRFRLSAWSNSCLIIGALEKLAEVYIGPMLGGGIEGWFAYVAALLFLLVRPEGMFGEKN